ncbi:MAG: hypothetical protein WC496_06395 [Phycisphaerae bacterium]|jgi:hypothetical protein
MKKLLILASILAMCSVVWAEEKKAAEPEKEKPDYRSVIVNAWLVKVDADALAKSGVKPLSEKDKENVSVMNLIWCLGEPNSGSITASAATRAMVKTEVENVFTNETYFGDSTESFVGDSSRPITSRTYRSYGQKVEFWTRSSILGNKQVYVEWSFKSKFIYSKIENKCPPDSSSVDYRNITVVLAQKPVIVAQTQIGNDMFFLVLRAEIVE